MNKKSLIHNLHPFSALFYIALLFIVSLTYTHPLYLLSLFLLVVMGILVAGAGEQWQKYISFGIFMFLLIVVVNALVSPYGTTVIFKNITLEAVLYGVNMAAKIILAISIFCLYGAIVDSDKLLALFSRIAPKSAVTAIMTTLILPKIRNDLERIAMVMSARGAQLHSRNLFTRIRMQYPLWKILLLSSLEGSWKTAEAMYSKAFGTGKRTYYAPNKWLLRDSILVCCCILALLIFILSLAKGKGFYNFYPELMPFEFKKNFFFAFVLFLCFGGLLFLDWGWRYWKFLRQRI